MDPSRFSLRSVIEAMPTPRSKTRRESLILSLHMVRLVLAQWTVVNSMRIILAQNSKQLCNNHLVQELCENIRKLVFPGNQK